MPGLKPVVRHVEHVAVAIALQEISTEIFFGLGAIRGEVLPRLLDPAGRVCTVGTRQKLICASLNACPSGCVWVLPNLLIFGVCRSWGYRLIVQLIIDCAVLVFGQLQRLIVIGNGLFVEDLLRALLHFLLHGQLPILGRC